MLRFNFIGAGDLREGIEILSEFLNYEIDAGGIPVTIRKTEKDLMISSREGKAEIGYARKSDFFRALSILAEETLEKPDFNIVETPRFDMSGACYDVSRNAVLKVESMRRILESLAIMGINTVILYMEDTYTIPEQPYFGYMRGRYSHDELKAMDDYADIFGIEMIPCIQTLAHLSQFLKWDVTRPLQDTGDILLANSDPTYEFIEQAIRAASAPFRTKRIHVGMDEAHSLGLGNYLDRFGLTRKVDIMLRHLAKVREIAAKQDLKLMIWSDTFMNSIPQTGTTETDGPAIPEGIQLVNWDYGTHEAGFYAGVLRTHQKIDPNTAFASGIWIWRSIGTNFGASFKNINESMSACKRVGVRDVFTCMWGDDGAENNMFSPMLGLQLCAEHAFSETVDTERLKKRILTCTGIPYEDHMLLNLFDETPGTIKGNLNMNNPSKFLLYQDMLMGVFDKHIEGVGPKLAPHYRKLERSIKAMIDPSRELDFIFNTPLRLVSVLTVKCDIGLRLKKAYDSGDLATIGRIANVELPRLAKRIDALRVTHRAEWHRIYKPFGWEVLDNRYGGLISRTDSVRKRLNDYLEGRETRLEELEQERLTFHGRKIDLKKSGIGGHTRFGRLYTTSN